MVDTLRCDEVLSPARHSSTPIIQPYHDHGTTYHELHDTSYHDLLPHFCHAYRDRAILDDERVFRNLLDLERFYMAKMDHYQILQDEIKIHMRKVVAEWMLDVCVDQRCNVDVFLLAANIMDRFLETIKLQKNQFQLLGAAAIFLASKMIEPSPISALTLVKCTADTYNRDELLAMELLILSKLKWDLTAVTSYDYLDHLLDVLLNPNKNLKDHFRHPIILRSSSADEIRRNTEKLITLCATDADFMELPPSLVATSSLIVAIRQDLMSSLQPGINLNQVIEKIRTITPLNMDSLRENVEKMERIFLGQLMPNLEDLSDQLDDSGVVTEISISTETAEADLQPNESTSASSRNLNTQTLNEVQSEVECFDEKNFEMKDQDRQNDNATPTEVFNVAASCVT